LRRLLSSCRTRIQPVRDNRFCFSAFCHHRATTNYSTLFKCERSEGLSLPPHGINMSCRPIKRFHRLRSVTRKQVGARNYASPPPVRSCEDSLFSSENFLPTGSDCIHELDTLIYIISRRVRFPPSNDARSGIEKRPKGNQVLLLAIHKCPRRRAMTILVVMCVRKLAKAFFLKPDLRLTSRFDRSSKENSAWLAVLGLCQVATMGGGGDWKPAAWQISTI